MPSFVFRCGSSSPLSTYPSSLPSRCTPNSNRMSSSAPYSNCFCNSKQDNRPNCAMCVLYVCVVCARPTPVNCMPINSVRCLLIHNLWMHDRRTETNMKWTYYDYIFYWVWRLCISSLSVWIVWPFRVCCSRPTFEWLMAYKSFNVSFNRSHIHIDRHPYEYIMTMNYDVCITEYRSTAKCGQVLCVHFTVQHPKRGDDKILLQKSYIRANVSVVYHRFCSEGRLSVLQTAWRLIQCSNAQMHLFIIFRTDKLLANVINCEQ